MAAKGEERARRTRVTVDFGRVAEDQFEPAKSVRVATIRGGKIIDQTEVTPADYDDPRSFEVDLQLGEEVDGVSGATVVVAPADDERNLFADRVAKTHVAGVDDVVDGGTILVQPGIYKWWRWCWFPTTYRVTGRVVRHEGDCTHGVGGAIVELSDVDYCWWWYDEDVITTGATDADGYFDIEFTWCRPLFCLWPINPPILVDPYLRDYFLERIRKWPIPLPDPPGPWELERSLIESGIQFPQTRTRRGEALASARLRTAPAHTATEFKPRARSARAIGTRLEAQATTHHIADLLHDLIIWPGCDDPCDWYPDIRIRVTQSQPGGNVEIYRDSFFDIHWNVTGDILDLELEADEDTIVGDDCAGEPLLGNCMLFERVGGYGMPAIYQPDAVGTATCGSISYGTTPTKPGPGGVGVVGNGALLGYTVSQDRPWCLTPSVYGEFGLAASVDYYQVQRAKWTPGDIAAFEADCAYRPPEARWQTLTAASGLRAFSRSYATLETIFGFNYYAWHGEGFSPHTFAGVPNVYKSRQRFEQEWVAANGGVPAPDFAGGWRWNTSTMTRLFDVDTSGWQDGLYSFRLVGYTQGSSGGSPTLTPVDQGLNAGPGVDGVLRRCGGSDAPVVPDMVTLYVDNQRVPDCEIVSFTKNGTIPIGECEMIILDTNDWLDIVYRAQDTHGNLGGYAVHLRRGSGPNRNIRGGLLGPHVTISGSSPEGPSYTAALGQGATRPDWNGGTWTARVPAAAFAAMGGSCAYNLALDAHNRHTNGWSAGGGWGAVDCDDDVAFTVILSADKATFCTQLGCCD